MRPQDSIFACTPYSVRLAVESESMLVQKQLTSSSLLPQCMSVGIEVVS